MTFCLVLLAAKLSSIHYAYDMNEEMLLGQTFSSRDKGFASLNQNFSLSGTFLLPSSSAYPWLNYLIQGWQQ